MMYVLPPFLLLQLESFGIFPCPTCLISITTLSLDPLRACWSMRQCEECSPLLPITIPSSCLPYAPVFFFSFLNAPPPFFHLFVFLLLRVFKVFSPPPHSTFLSSLCSWFLKFSPPPPSPPSCLPHAPDFKVFSPRSIFLSSSCSCFF